MYKLLNAMKEIKFMESEIYKRMDFYYIATSKINKCFKTMKFENNKIQNISIITDNIVYSIKTLDMESRLKIDVFSNIKEIFTLSSLENCVLAKKVSDISKLMDEEIKDSSQGINNLIDSIISFRTLILSDPSDLPDEKVIESINILLILANKIKDYIHSYYTTELVVLNYLTKLIIIGNLEAEKRESAV